MKYNPWPTKEEAPPVVKSKESTSKKIEAGPKKLETCQPIVGRVLTRRATRRHRALR
jgi:hypothetical protein